MNEDVAIRVLETITGWNEETIQREAAWLQLMANFKYDGYRDYLAGARFTERLADWLQQFSPEQRQTAYDYVRNRLIFVSLAEMRHLVALFFPSVIEKALLNNVAATLLSPNYLVWTHPQAEDEFKRALRKTLFFGLSDGARMDTFRRLNEGMISNEQVLVAPQVNRVKWAEVLRKLRKALGDEEARFSRVFLIDDFVGSGKTLLRWEEEERKWDGKLLRFWEDGQTVLDNGQTVFASHFEPSWSLHVHHYIASWEGKRNVEDAYAQARRERPAGTWFEHVDFTFGLVFDSSLPLQTERDAAMWALTEQYYDPSIQTKSTAVGGEHVKRGFGNCGLPVILEHNTPNNSLALLWADTMGGEGVPAMRPLFRRAQRHW